MSGGQGRAGSPRPRPSQPRQSAQACAARVCGRQPSPTQRHVGAVQCKCLGDTQASKPHRHHTDWPFRDRGTATRHQKPLEGWVAKSPTEWGSTFSQDESFWWLNLKIQYLWNESSRNSAETRNTFVLVSLNELLVLRRTLWSWGEDKVKDILQT